MCIILSHQIWGFVIQQQITNTSVRETKAASYLISGLSIWVSRHAKIPRERTDFWDRETNKKSIWYIRHPSEKLGES